MSGTKVRPVILWDTSIYLAWFKREKDKDLAAIAVAAREVMGNHVVLFVSSITRAEILNTAAAPSAREKFKKFCKRPNVSKASPDERIIDLAVEIRQDALNEHLASNKTRRKLKTPDAIIAATAIIYKATTIFAFDGDLLTYSGHAVLRGLRVIHPESLLPPPPPAKAKNRELFDEQEEASSSVVVATVAGKSPVRGDEHPTATEAEHIAEEFSEEDEEESVEVVLPDFAFEDGEFTETPIDLPNVPTFPPLNIAAQLDDQPIGDDGREAT